MEISKKEGTRLLVLIFLLVVCFGILVQLKNAIPRPEKSETVTPKRTFLKEIAPAPGRKVDPLPFREDDSILETITDDKYLHTKAFFYLVHKALVSQEQEMEKKLDPSFGWAGLVKQAERNKIRGKIMKIRGGIADLSKYELDGEEAKERGMQGVEYWQGLIYTAQGNPYLFLVTQYPQDISPDDDVEMLGAFFKVWIYENRLGQQTYAPFFIGKRLKRLPPPAPAEPLQLIWIFSGVIFLVAFLLAIGIFLEKRESRTFWESYRLKQKERKEKRKRGEPVLSCEETPPLEGSRDEKSESRKKVENEPGNGSGNPEKDVKS